jgi:hypothetical protein
VTCSSSQRLTVRSITPRASATSAWVHLRCFRSSRHEVFKGILYTCPDIIITGKNTRSSCGSLTADNVRTSGAIRWALLLVRGESGKDLEREANAMMRDPKQAGQAGQSLPLVLPKKVTLPSQEDQSHPSRRTVIVGLVGLTLMGCGIIWVTSACCSRSKLTLLFIYEGHPGSPVQAVAWSPDGKRTAGPYGAGMECSRRGPSPHV